MWRDAALIGEVQLWSPGLEDGAAGPAAGSGTCAEKGPCLLGQWQGLLDVSESVPGAGAWFLRGSCPSLPA